MATAMIWGATGGIGRALVDELLSREWAVVAVSRDEEALEARVACSLRADVADPFSVQRAVQAAAYEVDEVALWIYAAGDIASAPVEEITPAVWGRILSANLTGAYHAAHYSLPLLAPDAHIVFIGAISERLRLPGLSAYAATKAGLEAFAEVLRKEQRPRRVTVVRPAAVATPLWDKVPLRLPKDAPPPSKVAGRILAAHEEGHSGFLDLA
jgi:NAD(P)-dependent dehydrogenase (short-subunit alcohol dehydrogenase family)